MAVLTCPVAVQETAPAFRLVAKDFGDPAGKVVAEGA